MGDGIKDAMTRDRPFETPMPKEEKSRIAKNIASYDWLDFEGQGLLQLKKEITSDLTDLNADKYEYRLKGGGFPEATVNELMRAAFNMGARMAVTKNKEMRQAIIDDLRDAIEGVLK